MKKELLDELTKYLYKTLPEVCKLKMIGNWEEKSLRPPHLLYDKWGTEARGSCSWLQRVANWERSKNLHWITVVENRLYVHKPGEGTWSRQAATCWAPVFNTRISSDLLVFLEEVASLPHSFVYINDRETSAPPTFSVSYGSDNVNNNQEQTKMQKLMNDMVSVNKDALAVAAKLSVGKAANSTLLSVLASKLPWYSRLFGGKKDLMENPLARVASAQLALALSKHFAPSNEKLSYVAEAMLQESMVELVVQGEQLQSLIKQLEGLAGNVTGDAIK